MLARALLVIGLVGCAAKADAPKVSATDDALAEDGSDANAVEADTAVLAMSFLSAAARPIVAPTYFQPAGCLVSTRDDVLETATITLTHCAGPLGLRDVSGSVAASWQTLPSGAFELTLTGDALHVNRATLGDQWTATATITAQGSSRVMTWTSSFDGATARGRAIHRDVTMSYAWTIGDDCIAASGASTGDVTGRELDTTVTDFQRCGALCPAKGVIDVQDVAAERSLSITFDGSTTAEVTLPGGAAERVSLSCAEN